MIYRMRAKIVKSLCMQMHDTNVSSTLTQANGINAELVPELTKICDWLVTNKLCLNIVKTAYMIIGTEQSLIQLGSILKIKIKDCYLRRVEKNKALDLIIDGIIILIISVPR